MILDFYNHSCLLIIDIQKDNESVHQIKKLSSNILKLISLAREKNILICYIFLVNNQKSYWTNFKTEIVGNINKEGLPLDFIVPEKNEEIVFKNAYDSFFETRLHSLLKRKKIHNLYICGALTGVCVLNTVFSAFNLGYRIILVENCCSDKNLKRHNFVFKNYSKYLFIKDKI